MSLDLIRLISLIKDADLKIRISDLVGENIQLRNENFELKKQLSEELETKKTELELVFDGNRYYRNSGQNKVGPFCTNCWDSEHKLIRLHVGEEYQGLKLVICPKCQTHTGIGHYIQPQNPGGVNWPI